MYEYRARILQIIDGDTIKLDIDLGFGVHHIHATRLHGIDAPEKGTDAGRAAKEHLSQILAAEIVVVIHTMKDKLEKYGRVLAKVYLSDGRSVADVMIADGHAVPYFGGKRAPG